MGGLSFCREEPEGRILFPIAGAWSAGLCGSGALCTNLRESIRDGKRALPHGPGEGGRVRLGSPAEAMGLRTEGPEATGEWKGCAWIACGSFA